MNIQYEKILVRVAYDPAAKVWIAQGLNLKGLVVEAETQAKLREYIADLIPLMIELNGAPTSYDLACRTEGVFQGKTLGASLSKQYGLNEGVEDDSF